MNEIFNNKTYCPFGKICKGESKCDKALTPSIAKTALDSGKVLMTYVAPHKDWFEDKR